MVFRLIFEKKYKPRLQKRHSRNTIPRYVKMNIEKRHFGTIEDQKVDLFTMKNDNGMSVQITNFGGIITSLKVPDRNGEIGDVVLGFDNLEDYLGEHPYFGAIVGRYANRISEGNFDLGGEKIQVSQNENPNHLHGGFEGFDKKIWNVEAAEANESEAFLKLKYLSRDGEEGFPGNLNCEVIFSLRRANELSIKYRCTTDKTTVVNLTHHDYFNLKNGGATDVLGHELTIFAEAHTPSDDSFLPTGEVKFLNGQSFDFQKPKRVGDALKNANLPFGFNHNFVLRQAEKRLKHAANLYDPESGRLLKIFTTQPGIQLYTAGYLEKMRGKGGVAYQAFHGLCLEGQHFPDSPNHSNFPSTVLRPGEIYEEEYLMKFEIP